MSESTQNISEGAHSQESLQSISRIEDIIGVAPEYSDKIQRYERQISSLSPEEQSTLIEKWKQEITSGTANMGVFGRLIREFRTRERQEEKVQVQEEKVQVEEEKVQVQEEKVQVETKEVQVETKEVQVQEEKVQVEEERTKYRERYDRAIVAAEGALKSGEKIQGVIGTVYSSEIDARIQKDKSEIENPSSEISKLLTSMGIEASQALTTPGVEKILQARAMTQVYLANQDSIIKSHPELKGEIREFEGYRFDLGVQESAPSRSVTRLLSDIPQDTRGQVVDTVTALTQSNPDTLVTRAGDTLTFTDPNDDKYSYEIDMSEQPPRLAKSLNGLSISRELVPLTQEQKEKHNLETKKVQIIKTVARDSQAVKLTNIAEVTPDTIQSSDAVKSYEGAQVRYKEARNPTEKLSALKDLKSQNHLLESARRDSLTTENMGDEKYGKLEEALFSELEGLSRLETSLSQYLEVDKGLGRYNGVETQGNMENFDTFASENLGYLVDRHFDRLGPDANTALYRIIREINRNRDDKNKITIDKRAMNEIEKKTLRDALIQIGGTPDVLTNGEKLPALQKRITESLRYTRDNPRSIERILSEGASETAS